MIDTKINRFTAFLVRILLAPKAYFVDKDKQDTLIKEPSIIVCNHTSHLDGPFINTVLEKNDIWSLAAKDRFDQVFFGFFLRHTACIPIDREHPDTTWLHESLRILRNDRQNVAIYPEGRHGTYRKQLPFHSGVTTLAVLAQVPIVMVYVDGPVRFFHRNSMIIAPPIRLEQPTGGLTTDYVEAQTEFLQGKMKELMEEFIRITSSEE